MALDTYASLSTAVLARCPVAGPLLARQWVEYAFRRVAEHRRWSWLQGFGQMIFPAVYSTGTADVTLNSNTVSGTSTTWTAAMVGRQFRVGMTTPIYTITAVGSATSLTLDAVYGSATQTGVSYKIYQAYVTPPSDFHSFITGVDPVNRWRIWFNQMTQADLDRVDPQRSYVGYPYIIAFRDYDTSTPPLPRYEVWPHQQSARVIPYIYEKRPTDISDSGASIPRYIRGDVLLEGALAQASMWPGPSKERPNMMFNMTLAAAHENRFQQMTAELERQDDEVAEQDLTYSEWYNWPLAPFPLTGAYIQTHAI